MEAQISEMIEEIHDLKSIQAEKDEWITQQQAQIQEKYRASLKNSQNLDPEQVDFATFGQNSELRHSRHSPEALNIDFLEKSASPTHPKTPKSPEKVRISPQKDKKPD